MTIRIDENKLRTIIEEKHPKRIAFSAPDGLLKTIRELNTRLQAEDPSIQCIIIADPTYGSCDTVDADAQRLGADIAFHIGHNVRIPRFGKITYSIDAYDDIPFDSVATIAAKQFKSKGVNSVGLVAFAQHVLQLHKTAEIIESNGVRAIIGRGLGQLQDGQIFGCEFYPAFNIRNQVQAMALLGQSMFHAIGLNLSSGKPTYILDPYEESVVDVQQIAQERLKKSVLAIYKARDAENFGVIIGLKEGQIMAEQSISIKSKLESFGKKVQLLAFREITPDRINQLTGIEAFVQTGCPRVSVDGYNFTKPVLSVPQTDALINLLSGKEVGMDLFERKHWL
ncbi:MAG TPA: diphthamide biosynthesis enzyme Dph2 [Nitrososphaerales archaeon]|nr:diphthamide biosynthesis enzyme Dph2 [Nitrososphaerales archaeon]